MLTQESSTIAWTIIPYYFLHAICFRDAHSFQQIIYLINQIYTKSILSYNLIYSNVFKKFPLIVSTSPSFIYIQLLCIQKKKNQLFFSCLIHYVSYISDITPLLKISFILFNFLMDPRVLETPHPEFSRKMFAFGEEQVSISVTPYHKPSCTSKIINALEEEKSLSTELLLLENYQQQQEKPQFSVHFGCFLISRQLKVLKKHAIWFLFAGKPVRFSIR